MNKISINLLPQTVLLERIQSGKLTLVTRISIGVLTLIILITAGVLFLRVNQNRENNQVNDEVKAAENKVSALKTKEIAAFALKNRIDAISTKLGADEKVKQMFNLVVFLTPPEVLLYDATVDKNGSLTASFTSTSLQDIDKLFSNLTNKETNLSLITKVDLNGIALGRDSTYRFSLRITN